MYYAIPIQPMLSVTELYTVKRNNVWCCTDNRNILVFIKNGHCSFTMDSKKHSVRRGSFILIPANTAYMREHDNGTFCELVYFHFFTAAPVRAIPDTDAYERIRQQMYAEEKASFAEHADAASTCGELYMPLVVDMADKYDTMVKLITHIASGYQNSLHYNMLRRSLRFADLLSYLGTRHIETALSLGPRQPDSTVGQMPLQLQKTIFYIRQNYKNRITISELSSVANVSPQHLIRLFNKHLGTTPIKYINHLRILNSIELLRKSDMSVKEISGELGFENQNYFNRLFKQEEGMTPSEKRRSIRNYMQDHPDIQSEDVTFL